MGLLIGAIADDFTGATDLAGMLVKAGLRTVQMIGVPMAPLPAEIDAVVIALKSRTNPVDEAVRESLEALAYLQRAGVAQVYFKYCSTFDSTPRGNIGPVADALMDALGESLTVVCPAFPANARTIYKGYLFVGDLPLSESGMRDHPLTPMTDANLVRVLQPQTRRKVGLVEHAVVSRGSDAIRARFDRLRRDGVGYAVVDALTNDDLMALGSACAGMKLVTAGSGLALGLPQNFKDGLGGGAQEAGRLPVTSGRRAVISGSCSQATRRQVAAMKSCYPAFRIRPSALAAGEGLVEAAIAWALDRPAGDPVLVYATAEPDEVRAAQETLGVNEAGALVEDALSRIARGLVAAGFGQLVVAGGETAGAVVQALDVAGLVIGPEIDPGVPWTATLETGALGRAVPLALALKSGNFGTDDFFLKAWTVLDERDRPVRAPQ